MKLFKEISDFNRAVEGHNIDTPVGATTIEKLKVFAPLLIAILNFVKIFTGDAADAKINELIAELKTL